MKLKLKEAIIIYNNKLLQGESKMTQKKLARLVLPGLEFKSAYNYINKLCTGKAKTINIDVVREICKFLRTTSNFLFDLD